MKNIKIYLENGQIIITSAVAASSKLNSSINNAPAVNTYPSNEALTASIVNTNQIKVVNSNGTVVLNNIPFAKLVGKDGTTAIGASAAAVLSTLNSTSYFAATPIDPKVATNTSLITAEAAKVTALKAATKTDTGDRGVFVSDGKATTASHVSVKTSDSILQAGSHTAIKLNEVGAATLTLSVQAGTTGNKSSVDAITVLGNTNGTNALTTFNEAVDFDGSVTGLTSAAIPNLAASKITSGTFTTTRIPSLNASKIGSGTLADARVAVSNVTQHEASLSITESQISDLSHYTNASVDTHLNQNSATSGQYLKWTGTDYAWGTVSSGLGNIVEDTSPQLGGNLDVNGNKITSVSSGEVLLEPDASGVTRIANPNGNTTVLKLGGNTNSGGTIHLDFKHHTTSNNAGASIRSSGGSYGTGGLSFYAKGTNTSDGADLVADNLIASMSYNGGLQVYKNFSVLGGDLQFGHVGGNTSAEKRLGVRGDEPNSTQSSLHLEAGAATYSNRSGGNLRLKAGPGAGSGDSGVISFWTCEGIAAAGTTNTNLEKMRLSSEGYLGIGTTSPSEALDVEGNISVTGTVDGIDIATDVAANTAKTSFPGFGTTAGTALAGNTALFDGAYGSLSGTPSTFAPSSHNHAASEITSGTFSTARIPGLGASKITSGTFANARISQGSVTQHQAALTITESQISDLAHYTDASVNTHLNQSGASSGQYLKWTGSDYAWGTISSGGLGNIVEDTTPQLGGDLDVNGNKITSVSNGDIVIDPTGTGDILLKPTNLLLEGAGTTNVAEFRFQEGTGFGTNYVGFKAPASIATNQIYTLPLLDGTNGQVLSTNGSGTLSFVAQTADTNTNLGNTDMTLSGSRIVTMGHDLNFKVGSSSKLLYDTSANSGTGLWQFSAPTQFLHDVKFNGAGGTTQASIKFNEPSMGGTNGVILQGPSTNMTSDLTFTLPDTDGTNGQYLKTDGSGNLAFETFAVTGTAPIVSSGGNTPAISINTATTAVKGAMSAADKVLLNTITGAFVSDDVGGAKNVVFESINGISASAGVIVSMLQDTTADNTNANSKDFLGVVTSTSDQCVINGIVEISQSVPTGATAGRPLWLGASGSFIASAPTAANSYARVMGHYLGSVSGGFLVYFNPSNDWIQIDS